MSVVIEGRYELMSPLGQGGMGSVHEARDLRTGRIVALKTIRFEKRVRADDEVLRRFVVEARTAAALDSPHIPRIYDVGVDPETRAPFLVLERLHGRDLGQMLDEVGSLEPDVAARIAAQAAEALAVAHAEDIIHRDIKPGNLFLCDGKDGQVVVKVLDFGIAKGRRELVGTENMGLTSTDRVIGTPLYMSPEQAIGLKTIDARTDVWSLGVVLFRALCGTEPFRGAENVGLVLLSICTSPLPPVQDEAPWVSDMLARVVHGALRRAPTDRFASARELREALLSCTASGKEDIHQDELVGVSDATKSQRMPKIELPRDAPLAADGRLSVPDVGTDPALSTIGGTADPVVTRTDGVDTADMEKTRKFDRSDTEPKPSERNTLLWAGAAAVVTAVGVVGAQSFTGGDGEPAPSGAPSEVVVEDDAPAASALSDESVPSIEPEPQPQPTTKAEVTARTDPSPPPTPRASAKPKPIVKPPPARVDCDNNAFYMGPEGKLILRPECK